MKIPLGVTVQDKITGFFGRVTGRCEYLTGCNQVLVQPMANEDGTFVEARWFDEQRCAVNDSNVLKIDNGDTPGFDVPAPVR